MKDVLKYLPLTTIIIAYLFICGGIYLLGFWGTFNIDAFAFMQIWDIPKSFIAPFMYAGGAAVLLQLSFGFFVINNNDFGDVVYPIYLNQRVRTVILSLILVTGVFLSRYFQYNMRYWMIFLFVFAPLFILELQSNNFIKKIIPKFSSRFILIFTIISFPTLSFMLGKKNSLRIYHNEYIKIINSPEINIKQKLSDTIPLKLIGFMGDKFIVGTLNNNKIFVLAQSAFNVIELNEKK